MAILIEAISLVKKVGAIEHFYPGGFEAFEAKSSNATLCADEELIRLGFMTPADVESFVEKLKDCGIKYIENDNAIDMVVIDQIRGPTIQCDWIEFGHISLEDNKVAIARMVGSEIDQIFTPEGWEYETSLSNSYGFVPEGQEDKSLKFLRHENGMDVYLSLLTGKEVFIGRTDQD